MARKREEQAEGGVSHGKGDAHVVLVGTYRGGQLKKWRGWYNYPVSDKDKITEADAAKVTELWLFNGTKDERRCKAEFVGVKTRAELVADYGYPAKGKAHADKYLLFKTAFKYRHKDETPEDAERVIIRLKDFATSPKVRSQLKAYLESPDRRDPDLAKRLPEVITRLKPDQLRVCEAAYQMTFFSTLDKAGFICRLANTNGAIEENDDDGRLTCVEICAGAGGQAIGLDAAGFKHVALVEYESEYCDVLKKNKPSWNVICADVHSFDGRPYAGVDLLAGGVPCPPFSVASKQLGERDERDLFPEAIRLVSEIRPKAVMLENVRGLLNPKFDEYRSRILRSIENLGYKVHIKLLQANDYGVSQIRPRVIIIGIRNDLGGSFTYPAPNRTPAKSVGELLLGMMGANGWRHAEKWSRRANRIAPTIVGGSKKHGGPDLGPTRARRSWAELDVDGTGVANNAPPPDFTGSPKLTKEMIAAIQGFPSDWDFGKKKTSACRMIGNAFPPPVAKAVGLQIRKVLNHEKDS